MSKTPCLDATLEEIEPHYAPLLKKHVAEALSRAAQCGHNYHGWTAEEIADDMMSWETDEFFLDERADMIAAVQAARFEL